VRILLWLAVPLAVTALAMVWAGWAGRTRTAPPRDDEETQRRLGEALGKPLPAKARHQVTQPPDRPSGIAVRPSQRRGGAAEVAAPSPPGSVGRR
jgi:hypothetical protein